MVKVKKGVGVGSAMYTVGIGVETARGISGRRVHPTHVIVAIRAIGTMKVLHSNIAFRTQQLITGCILTQRAVCCPKHPLPNLYNHLLTFSSPNLQFTTLTHVLENTYQYNYVWLIAFTGLENLLVHISINSKTGKE